MKKIPVKRISSYLIGHFILALGVTISIKANLGVSPVSSVPYSLSLVTGLELGRATILIQTLLVFAQLLILRREFGLRQLLQLPVGILSGYFITLASLVMDFVPAPQNLVTRLGLLLVSIIVIGAGISAYLRADLISSSNEGIVQVIAAKTGRPFSRIKTIFDLTMVVISSALCLGFLGKFGSIGVGTLIAATTVGGSVGIFNRLFDRIETKPAKDGSEIPEATDATTDSAPLLCED